MKHFVFVVEVDLPDYVDGVDAFNYVYESLKDVSGLLRVTEVSSPTSRIISAWAKDDSKCITRLA